MLPSSCCTANKSAVPKVLEVHLLPHPPPASHVGPGPGPPPRRRSDEPLLLALLDGLGEGRVADDDRRVRTVCRVGALGLVGVVGAFMAEHVAHHEHHDAEDGEDHHGDDAWRQMTDDMVAC